MSPLRRWQSECIDKALRVYQTRRHFLCQATPGAGKTMMAASLAARLLSEDKIDLVFCFSPSVSVAAGIKQTFSHILNARFDGKIGAVGGSYTYQSMSHFSSDFWSIIRENRVFVVFDEIHHCAGQDAVESNVWGQKIIANIQEQAAFTLALSGTPWRSDRTPISLARYSDPEGRIQCDYSYSFQVAVSDGVCRAPNIVLVDNENLRVSGSDLPSQTFGGIKELLQDSNVGYDELLRTKDALEYVLKLGCEKLEQIRARIPDAAGLVVTSSIEHAYQVANLLRARGEMPVTVTYQTLDAQGLIHRFKLGNERWLVSVGMVSEGTDIPRLQVCCHLSRVRTELYFRQVLGRIVRARNLGDMDAWLFMLAEPDLSQFAHRVGVDLPEQHVVSFDIRMREQSKTGSNGNALPSHTRVSELGVEFECSDSESRVSFETVTSCRGSNAIGVEFLGAYRDAILAVFS